MAKIKKKRKVNKVSVAAVIVSIICILELLAMIAACLFANKMLEDKPTFNIDDFENSESSKIYDSEDNIIAELGMTIRENVSYEDLPNCVIDAFVAVEDSRYFTHNGFDIARFTAALINNVKTMSFSQGGSTFSMQLVKNTYFVDDEAGINAPKKVSRKAQEIVLAMELERNSNKETIFELYVNKLNFGGDRNIRGIQKASEYYFNKDVSELNIAEAALLAGVINAPYSYNPYRFLEASTERRNTVLYQMYNHGYISESEYELAKSIKVEDLLVDESDRTLSSGTNDDNSYQAYIDAVVLELNRTYNLDPYTTPMKVYTYMSPELQELADQIQEDALEEFEYPDEDFEVASISIDTQTGAIRAVVGGRNYADGGELLLNHAIDQYKQPGSSIKPILDYSLAFEHLGWATSHVLVDKPVMYAGTNFVVSNSNGRYVGEVRLRDAVGNSLNTTAIQTLEQVIEATSTSEVVAYMNAMGFEQVTVENFNIQYAIGGADLTVSVLQMAGAQAAIINGGTHNTPHTIEKIEFLNGKSPINEEHSSNTVLSAQAAYLMSDILYSNVYGGYANLMQILQDEYPVYAKTGTTDWGTDGREYGIPDGAVKDGWLVASTSENTVATWIGYEKASVDKQSYILWDVYVSNIQGKITNALLDKYVELYGSPEAVSRPDGITSITHILATFPYAATIEGMDSQYITSGLIKTEDAQLVSPESVDIYDIDINNSSVSISGYDKVMDIVWPQYPDASALSVADNTLDISLRRSDGTAIVEAYGTKLFDYSWVYGPVRYKADITINGGETTTIQSEDSQYSETLEVKAGDSVDICLYYGYENRDNPRSENEACFYLQLEDYAIDLQLPEKGLSQEEIKAYQPFSQYNVNVEIKEVSTSDKDLVDTYTFQLEFGGSQHEYAAGSSVNGIKLSELDGATITVNYYIKEARKLSISANKKTSEITPGSEVSFSVEGAGSEIEVSLQADNEGISWKDQNSLTIQIKDDVPVGSTFTLTIKDVESDTTISETFTVNEK